MHEPAAGSVVRDTRNWLERAVIGLNLCPFAKAVHVKEQVHYAVSTARDTGELLGDLGAELDALLATDPSVRETTLLIAPYMLHDFLDFNDFVGSAERLLRKRRLDGEIQLASFHPHYQFAGTQADDVTNFTNRSPYPVLHLLRETSIDRAVEAFPDAASIYDTNMQTMKKLGADGWAALDVGPHE
ncbi:DUF1415 domain-containing protein [Caenimonas sp. SL110]|uniref:DUF1415 domain-containing protein n=1 Tax=Caenimonas sp. SL110 TaxID=1450524 RepID=UPI00065352AC|nr:DUF1415 domain-containing protein [Caenimonas sp. SL110]